MCYSLHAYLQILHDSIALQSNSLSPTDFDWKRYSGWEEFEPIGSLELLYLMCLQDKLWQQYVYFIHEWVKMYVVLCVFGILTVLMPWPCRIFWMTIWSFEGKINANNTFSLHSHFQILAFLIQKYDNRFINVKQLIKS